jgi:hypothetical protein
MYGQMPCDISSAKILLTYFQISSNKQILLWHLCSLKTYVCLCLSVLIAAKLKKRKSSAQKVFLPTVKHDLLIFFYLFWEIRISP